jgi:hypothetical protein
VKTKLELREVGRVHAGRVIGDGPIYQYSVEPLARGEQIFVANFGGKNRAKWRVLRINDGVSGGWAGEYESAEEVLAILQGEDASHKASQ